MFGFVKKIFFVGLTILSSFTNVNSLSCISVNNQESRIYRISKCPELEVIGKIFKNHNPLEEYSVRIYEIDRFFINMKKIQGDKNRCKYKLLRIDIYFSEYILVVKIDEKEHTNRDLIFEEKIQEALKTCL